MYAINIGGVSLAKGFKTVKCVKFSLSHTTLRLNTLPGKIGTEMQLKAAVTYSIANVKKVVS